jgi:hypothetical protein
VLEGLQSSRKPCSGLMKTDAIWFGLKIMRDGVFIKCWWGVFEESA